MTTTAAQDLSFDLPDAAISLAPRPRTIEETGLSRDFLGDLLLKHLYNAGVLTLEKLSERSALSGGILEDVLAFLRTEGFVEVRSADKGAIRYALTDRGRAEALDALGRNDYAGPAPITLETYEYIVRSQSVHDRSVTRETMRANFYGFIIRDEVLDTLGPALHSGRAIFIYGPAGTGKTYTTKRLMGLLSDSVLIPHAIVVNETVIPLFDPVVHKLAEPPPVNADRGAALMFEHGHDPRYVRCERPNIVTGGELSLDMLDLYFDSVNKRFSVPLQLKANNGVFLLDDLGRQRAPTRDLLNRWIVPMEEQRDYLSLGSGHHFPVPFDLVLFFSTNMNPLDLADEAFLRRIGHKIGFDYLTEPEYIKIWWQVCEEQGIECDTDVVHAALHELHKKHGVKLLPCHPRDLLGLAVNRSRYLSQGNVVTVDALRWAWDNYFVRVR